MQHNGWDHALKVTADGTGLVGHAGAVLLRKAADQAGLTGQLSAALRKAGTSPLFDRGAVLVSMAAAIALGAASMSDIAVLAHLAPVLGGAPSGPTVRRALDLAGTPAMLDRIARARAKARAHAWQLIERTPAGFPWPVIAGKTLTGWLVIDMDATLVTASSDKEGAAPTWKKGYGFFSEPENDHVMGWSSGLVVRPAVSPKVGMPRPTAALRRVVWLSIWASLMFAPARLILRPSASPSHRSRSASVMRSVRLSRISRSRVRWAGSGRRRGQRRQLCSWMQGVE